MRFGAAVAFDAGSDRIVLFGGGRSNGASSHSSEVYDDTWVYDTGTDTWTLLDPPTAPSPRMNASMVYDPTTDRILLWGGEADKPLVGADSSFWSSGVDSAVWSFDPTTDTWTKLSESDTSPPVTAGAGWFYVPTHESLVLIGGRTATPEGDSGNYRIRPTPDVYAYDPTTNTWSTLTSIPPTVAGPGNAAPAAAYDPLTNLIIVYGRGNTETYDPTDNSWTQVNDH